MNLKTNEIIALALFAAGLFDLYLLPKIFTKAQPNMPKEQMARILMIFKIASYVTIGIGVLFLLGIIPLSQD